MHPTDDRPPTFTTSAPSPTRHQTRDTPAASRSRAPLSARLSAQAPPQAPPALPAHLQPTCTSFGWCTRAWVALITVFVGAPTNPTSVHQLAPINLRKRAAPRRSYGGSPWTSAGTRTVKRYPATGGAGGRRRSYCLACSFVLSKRCTRPPLLETVLPALQAPESSVPAAMAVAAAATASVTASVTARGRRRDEVRCAAEVGAAHVIPTAAFARPMNLLIVDNDAMVRRTMATLLQQCGYNVETAKNGREGLAMMKMQRFHLTLSDIIMPVIDGIEMTRQLREWEAVHRPAWRQPLMLMSAAANNELSQRVSR